MPGATYEQTKRYRAANPEKVRAWRLAYYRRNAEKIRAAERDRRQRRPEALRNSRLKSVYGITVEDYDALLTGQDGLCAICLATTSGRAGRPGLYVDHDHVTGRVRGLVCHGCNVALARFEKPDNLARLNAYLI